jgi:hypothetical protein
MTMKVRVIAGVVAAIFIGVGVALLATPVSATTRGDEHVACGSVWSPDTGAAESAQLDDALQRGFAGESGSSYDGFKQVCDDSRSTRGGFGWTVLSLGVLGGLVLLAEWAWANTGAPQAPRR